MKVFVIANNEVKFFKMIDCSAFKKCIVIPAVYRRKMIVFYNLSRRASDISQYNFQVFTAERELFSNFLWWYKILENAK